MLIGKPCLYIIGDLIMELDVECICYDDSEIHIHFQPISLSFAHSVSVYSMIEH